MNGRVGADDSNSSESCQASAMIQPRNRQAHCSIVWVRKQSPFLASTNATENDRKNYDAVMVKFDAFFQVRRNVLFERARFNRRNQLPGETAEEYIMALYSLAANCNYGALEAEMIRDRLVVGIRDNALSECLQLDAELLLEKAKKSIRQREAVHE